MTEVFNNGNLGKPSFSFVVATQTTEDDWRNGKKELPLMQSLAKMVLDDVLVKVYVQFGNKEGLPKTYNKAIDNIEDSDFICFVHDDWWLADCFFFSTTLQSDFDVIGVAGGLVYQPPFDWRTKPFLWTAACRGRASGFVMHRLNGGFYPSSFGPAPSPAVWLDGQCLILTRKAWLSGLRFCEDWRFDFYDGQLCFDALNKGLKVGTAPIMCIHESAGQGVMSHQEQYMTDQVKFVEKNLKII